MRDFTIWIEWYFPCKCNTIKFPWCYYKVCWHFLWSWKIAIVIFIFYLNAHKEWTIHFTAVLARYHNLRLNYQILSADTSAGQIEEPDYLATQSFLTSLQSNWPPLAIAKCAIDALHVSFLNGQLNSSCDLCSQCQTESVC